MRTILSNLIFVSAVFVIAIQFTLPLHAQENCFGEDNAEFLGIPGTEGQLPGYSTKNCFDTPNTSNQAPPRKSAITPSSVVRLTNPNATQPEIRSALQQNRAVYDLDIPGRDLYPGFAVQNPDECERACNSSSQCGAWTYVHPGVQKPHAMCWIKDAIPSGFISACCISGQKHARRQ